MLFDPDRHAPLQDIAWSAPAAREAIARIVRGAEEGFLEGRGWPLHPKDRNDPAPQHGFYFGDSGVVWALRYLQQRGAAQCTRDWLPHLATLRVAAEHGSYLFGETPILLQLPGQEERLAAHIEQTMHHPAREFMWGAPGTLLAALFLHRRTGAARWAELVRRSAQVLWEQLEWSEPEQCAYWTQDLYGRRCTYLDAVHGFVATACVLLQSRHLLAGQDWARWQDCIARTIRATATWQGDCANWRNQFQSPQMRPTLVQFCHGAPGFVICLAGMPGNGLDDLLLAAGELTWRAGPLAKGANLCHGTGGNGYAFLKLYRRFGDAKWLVRARAFAMHGIAQAFADHAAYGQWRHGLWTGDLGLAIYLLDCIEEGDAFPSLDAFDVRESKALSGSAFSGLHGVSGLAQAR